MTKYVYYRSYGWGREERGLCLYINGHLLDLYSSEGFTLFEGDATEENIQTATAILEGFAKLHNTEIVTYE